MDIKIDFDNVETSKDVLVSGLAMLLAYERGQLPSMDEYVKLPEHKLLKAVKNYIDAKAAS